MNLSKFIKENIFEILSIVLIVCLIDQLYMIIKYKNISIETFIFTVLLTSVSAFFTFLKKG